MRGLTVFHPLSRFIFIAGVLLISAGTVSAASEDKGPILSIGLSGSSNDPGWIYKLDTQAGYKFNRHFEVDFGLPVYFVHIPASETTDSISSKNGIGNAYVDFRFMVSRPEFYFSSSLRGTAPTGSTEEGFSTGRVTVDWNNYFERSFGSVTPFGSVGIANTVSDTHFFSRPFSSLGIVGHFEGGMYYQPSHWLGIAGSAYAVTPSGEQKIYSKVTKRTVVPGSTTGTGSGGGMGNNGSGRMSSQPGGSQPDRVFEETYLVEGSEEIAKDHGFSGWIDILPTSNLALELGYSRSVAYDYNSVFFSVRFDLSRMIRRNR